VNSLRCDGLSRRSLLSLGFAGALGWSLTDITAAAARPMSPFGIKPAESLILIWLDGGLSHIDSFDPKPNAPSEIRGPFAGIRSSIPGIALSEHLPMLASRLNQVTLIRSLTHELGNHDTGGHFVLTGHRANPALNPPSIGSLIAARNQGRAGMPAYSTIGRMQDFLGAGYLPQSTRPFAVTPGSSHGATLLGPDGHIEDVWARRLSTLSSLTKLSAALDGGVVTPGDGATGRALGMLTSSSVLSAFQVEKEPASVRQRYGNGAIGRNLLLARRLTGAGCRVVQVVDTGYDTHVDIHRELPDARFPGSGKLPSLDRGISALLDDLTESGRIDTTVVAVVSEFGRTPKLNASAGRDHWPRAGSVLLAGGPFARGMVFGATDARGESPMDAAVSPADIAATLLTAFAIDPGETVRTPDGRPVQRIAGGAVIKSLFA